MEKHSLGACSVFVSQASVACQASQSVPAKKEFWNYSDKIAVKLSNCGGWGLGWALVLKSTAYQEDKTRMKVTKPGLTAGQLLNLGQR